MKIPTSRVEFLEEDHTYVNSKGIVIPSVSEIIRNQFPEAYKGVPQRILKNKADYGTKVHHLIEDFIAKKITMEEIQKKRIDPNIKIALEEFERLRKKWCFYIEEMEQIVDFKEKYAGQFDLLDIEGTVIDIKTTSELHEDWLKLQLSLYYLALGIEKPHGYCMWLPKGKPGKVIQIPVFTHEETKEILKQYEKHNSK